jgi:general secretion pathway protein C
MASVRVKPHFVGGEPAGFRLTRIKSDSIFKTMGFQDGDVIRSVNGQPVRSAEDVMRAYNTLKDSSFFSMEILRNNRTKTLNFKVR